MSDNRKMTSIARRMSGAWFRRILWTVIVIDVTVILALLIYRCYLFEKQLGAGFDMQSRRLFFDSTLPFFKRITDFKYIVVLQSGAMKELALHDLIGHIISIGKFILPIEVLMLISAKGYCKRKCRELLAPLETLAADAQRLSNFDDAAFSEEQIKDLQDAISSLNTESSDAYVRTGDTELQGLENAVNSLIQKMRESYNQQARFVSDASHELRTPIAVIQGYANMLDRWGKTDEKVLEEGIAAIKTEADGMKNLVEQLLFLARGDSGRQKFNLTTFSLSELIREIHEEYNMIDSNHEWFLEMSEDDIVISGDESLIKQAVRIITDNAVKYTPQGGSITLRCRLNSIGEPSIQVQDSGIGIDQKDIPRMFDRFFRADPARTRNTGGTGLGLSIAKQIVDKHYGYFEVVSRMGIGTRMTINLPQGIFAQPQDKQG